MSRSCVASGRLKPEVSVNLLHAILLGLVQGLTEFLPVSSTAHLTLAQNLLLGQSMPLAFDVLLHVGTLVALLIYFRAEWLKVLQGILGRDAEGRRLGIWLLLAMVPTGVLAIATKPFKEAQKGHLWVYGVFLLVTAALLWIANRMAERRPGRSLGEMNALDALAVGAIQGLGGGAGLSRSGSTLTMGVFRGLALPDATRFSFLLGAPTIAAAAVMEGRKLVKPLLTGAALPAELAFPAGSGNPGLLCLVGVVAAGISGYLAIGLLDRFTRRPRLGGFAVYCALAGVAVLVFGR